MQQIQSRGPGSGPLGRRAGADTAARAWGTTLAANAVLIACGIATGGLVARLLHADGRGALAAIVLWPQLLADVGLFGVHEALTQRISSESKGRETALSTAIVLSIVLGTAAAFLGVLIVPLLVGTDRPHIVALARWYIVAAVPVSFLTLVLYAYEHGQRRFSRYNTIRIGVPVTYAAATALLWAVGAAQLETIVAANAAAAIVGLIIALWVVRPVGLRVSRAEAAALLKLSGHFSLTALLVVVSSQIDRILVVRFWDARSVGFYFVALTVSTTLFKGLAHSFHTVIFPNIAQYTSTEQQRVYLSRGLRHALLLACVSAAMLVPLTPWIVRLVFGQEFAPATELVVILLIAQIPATLRQVTVRALRGLGDATPGTIAEAVTGGALVLFAAILGSTNSLAGIAWATCAANGLSMIYLSRYLKQRLDLRVVDLCAFDRRTVLEVISFGKSLFAKA
jgi:O-antigen/teichoic acid export membrane protein